MHKNASSESVFSMAWGTPPIHSSLQGRMVFRISTRAAAVCFILFSILHGSTEEKPGSLLLTGYEPAWVQQAELQPRDIAMPVTGQPAGLGNGSYEQEFCFQEPDRERFGSSIRRCLHRFWGRGCTFLLKRKKPLADERSDSHTIVQVGYGQLFTDKVDIVSSRNGTGLEEPGIAFLKFRFSL